MTSEPKHIPQDQDILDIFNIAFRAYDDTTRTVLERTWMRNVLYYLGEQWLSWLSESGTFGRRYDLNIGKPTPVSNIIRDYIRSMKALTLNKAYTTTIWPNSEEQEDRDAAELGVDVLEWMNSQDDYLIDDIKEEVEIWRLLTGNGFTRTTMNSDSGSYVLNKSTKKAVTNAGEVQVTCNIPFNVVVSPLGTRMRDKVYTGGKDLVYRSWVEETYGIKLTGKGNDEIEVDYQKQLLTLVANVSPWKGRNSTTSDMLHAPNEDLTVLKWLEFKPTEEHTKGRYIVVCEGEIIHSQDELEIPVDDDSGKWHYSLTHFPFDYTPGSFWHTGGVDDLISPQNTVNRIDQALEVNRESLGQPMVMTPGDLTVKRISNKSQGLLSIKYDNIKAQGARPIIHPGTPYPEQVLKERDIQTQVAQDASGNPKNVLSGQSPSSSASGIMVDILRETAEQSHAPDIKRFYRAWNRQNRKRLLLVQAYYTESRLIKMKGKGNDIKVLKFIGSDLRNNVDIRLELDSGLSSTSVGKNAFLVNLIEKGFWGDINLKPQVQRELLKRMGMGGFPEEDNVHRNRAEYENSELAAGKFSDIGQPGVPKSIQMDKAGQPVLDEEGQYIITAWSVKPVTDPAFRIDNHLVHMQVHDQFILAREFSELPEKTQSYAIAHRVFHEEAWMAVEMERMVREAQAAEQGAADQSEGGDQPASGGVSSGA